MRPDIEKRITEQLNAPSMNLSGMGIQDDELSDIMTCLKTLKPAMACIDLDSNDIGDEGANILSKQLCDFAKMEEISIQYNEIGTAGALLLFGLKKDFPGLNILFRGNAIVDDALMYKIEREA